MAIVLGRFVDRSHYDCEHRFRIVAQPVHPSTLLLFAHWQSCEAQGGMRMGRDIPARAIAALMKDLTVAEPVDDWADARLRLVGSGMAAHFGRDVTGALMTEVFAGETGDRDMLLAGVKAVIQQNRPGTVEQTIIDKGREILRQEMTVFPLYAPNGEDRWALTGTFNF
jgi:hypothetical protein